MGVLIRGVRNAFRNGIRTLSVTIILAISIGLSLIMLLSYQTVQAKITSIKGSIGNTITVTPAGAQGFQGGGEPLTEDQVSTIRGLSNVVSVDETLADRMTAGTNNNLVSAIDAGTLGRRAGQNDGSSVQIQPPPGAEGGTQRGEAGGTTTFTRTFTVPIMVTGLSDPSTITSGTSKLTSGELFAAGSTDNVAVVGAALATKNNLSVGSTFTAYGTSIKVVGIFDAGTEFANAGLYMPIKTVQTLSGQAGDLTSATVTVNTITNVDSVASAITSKLGSDKADVTSNLSSVQSTLTPLENIRTISLYSLIGSLVAGAVITLLTMIMIVRERRREIGVLKAIGSSNIGVVGQFVSEAMVLTLLGSVLGMVVGVAFSNPVLSALVSGNESSGASAVTAGGGRGFARVVQFGGELGGSLQGTLHNLHAVVGPQVILYGLLAAIGIAILGSAIPAWLIAKVKPAEVMRGE